jgi:hypothetical protein
MDDYDYFDDSADTSFALADDCASPVTKSEIPVKTANTNGFDKDVFDSDNDEPSSNKCAPSQNNGRERKAAIQPPKRAISSDHSDLDFQVERTKQPRRRAGSPAASSDGDKSDSDFMPEKAAKSAGLTKKPKQVLGIRSI